MDRIEKVEEFPLIFKKAQNRSFNNNKAHLRRFMNKSGHLNLQLSQVPFYKYLRFTKDFANTLVLIRWRWVTLIVVLVNAFFYVSFAALWMFDAWLSGDFNTTKNGNFCIKATRNFAGYLLLSIETITTTGYGYLYPTENCQIAWIILTMSTIVMILIDGAFISVVFLKICKPQKKDALTLFSKRAVICLRNGQLCLILRINDHSNKHVIAPKVTVYYIDRSGIKKDSFKMYLREIEIKPIGMLLWPTDIVHQINKNSPFWNLSAIDLMNSKFEIFVNVSGSSLVTNQFSTSQTSYLNDEILWGYRFTSCMEFDEEIQSYKIVQHNTFKMSPCDTPLCSANKLREIEQELDTEARESFQK